MGMAELVVTAVVFEGRTKSEVARDLRPVAPVGDHPRPALPGGGRRRLGAAVETTAAITEADPDGDRGRDRRDPQGPRPGWPRGRSGHDRRPSPTAPWRQPGGLHDLADPGRTGLRRHPSPTSGPRAPTSASRPSSPTSSGRPTSPTGASPMAPTSRSSTSSMTTRGSASPASPARCSPPPSSMTASRKQLPPTGTPPTCSPTTAPSSRAATATAAASPSSSPSTNAGSRSGHSRPYHPQTCGKVERFHKTLKRWLATQPRARSLPALQRQLKEFRSYYNDIRPHRALSRRTPHEAYQARPKALPSGIPLDDAHYRVRHDTIDADGKLTIRHASRLHHIGIGRRHAADRSSSWSRTSTSASPQPTANCYATSPSTPPATTNPNPKRERCPETPVNGVSRHRMGVERGDLNPRPPGPQPGALTT